MTAILAAILIACGPAMAPLIDGERFPAGEAVTVSPITVPPRAPATAPRRGPTPVTRRVVSGVATWYGTGPGAGHAAAGPALRSALGHGWRGTRLIIWYRGHHVTVVVDDWCACGHGHLIDLSDEDFGTLTDFGKGPELQRGVIRVVVTR